MLRAIKAGQPTEFHVAERNMDQPSVILTWDSSHSLDTTRACDQLNTSNHTPDPFKIDSVVPQTIHHGVLCSARAPRKRIVVSLPI